MQGIAIIYLKVPAGFLIPGKNGIGNHIKKYFSVNPSKVACVCVTRKPKFAEKFVNVLERF